LPAAADGCWFAGTGGNAADVILQADDTCFFEVSSGTATSSSLRTTATHDAMNVGSRRYRQVMVELK
jgi:hypothetical protein